jgi:hypothetical protein
LISIIKRKEKKTWMILLTRTFSTRIRDKGK